MARLNVATWEEFKLQLVVNQLKKQLKEAENKIEDLERENSALTEEVNEMHKDLDFVTKGEDDIDKFLEALEKDLSEHPLKRKEDDDEEDTEEVWTNDINYCETLCKTRNFLKRYGNFHVFYTPCNDKVVIDTFNEDFGYGYKRLSVPFRDLVDNWCDTIDSVLDAFDINPYQE